MNTTITTVLVISTIVGIASYGASAAYQSWEKRNRAIRKGVQHDKYYFITRRVKKLFIVAGLTGLLISIISNFTMQREGLLYANNLSIIDTPKNLKPIWVFQEKSIKKGEIIAKFEPANPSLQMQKIGVQNNQLAEKAEIIDKISSLTTDISRASNESKINQGKLSLAMQRQATAARLADQGAMSREIQREREAEVTTIKQKALQIEDSLLLMKTRLNTLEQSYQSLDNIGSSNQGFDSSNKYNVHADANGDVLFRSNSLRRDSGLPLLIFGNDDSMSLQVRLLNHEAESLNKSKRVYAEWIEGRKPNQSSPLSYVTGIPKRFEVRVSKLINLDGDTDHKLAFLSAKVPPRAVVDIAWDRVVPARLVWKPSLYFNPTFRISALILFTGILLNLPDISKAVFSSITRKRQGIAPSAKI